MGLVVSVETLKKKVHCSICLELMTNPVVIDCGHSYCRSCIVGIFEKTSSSGSCYCPECREPFEKESIRPNKMLKIVTETIRDIEDDWECEKHGEKLQMFCEHDGKLLCWRCKGTPQHRGHVIAQVEEAYERYEVKLKEMVKKLKDMNDQCKNQIVLLKDQITEWEEKIKNQTQKVQSYFQKYHDFLYEEEKSYLERLKLEKEKIRGKLQDNKSKLEKQRHELEIHIQELEENCQRPAHYLLQGVKGTLTTSSAIKLEIPEAVSLEIPEAVFLEMQIFELFSDSNNFKKLSTKMCKHDRNHKYED